jgi:hypothetical protein
MAQGKEADFSIDLNQLESLSLGKNHQEGRNPINQGLERNVSDPALRTQLKSLRQNQSVKDKVQDPSVICRPCKIGGS